MKLIPPPGERLLPVLSGVLLVLSFPPAKLLVPPFVGLVPLLLFIAEQPDTASGRWSAMRASMVTGLIYFGLLLYWLVIALIYYSLLAIPAWAGTVGILVGFSALFGWAVHYTTKRVRLPLPLAAAIFWTTLEWTQGHLGDLSFPWLGLGSALAYFPQAAGAADLVGARGLTFWLALVNGMIAAAVLRGRSGRPVRALVAGAATLVALPVGYGLVRAATLELRPAARVAVVQPNIPEDLKLDRRVAVDSSMTALANLNERIPEPVDLVAWPEVAVPALVAHPSERALARRIQALSADVGAPFVVGAYGMSEDPDSRVFYNSAFVIDGRAVREDPYHKQYLVPFVERIPFVDPAWLESIIGDVAYFGGLGRGRTRPVLGAGGRRYGILICYESIFAPLSRAYRREGADFLVNITNDAWYGREAWYARTTALWQHPAHLRMRAIETRIGIARAANTGISMFVDPIGRSYERTELFEPAVRTATVYTTDGTTLFVRWGDWLSTLAVLAAVTTVLTAWLRSRRRERPATGDEVAQG